MRRLAIALLVLAALALTAAGGFAWWISRDATLVWLLERGASAGGFQATHEGLSGTLFTPIRAARLRLENDDLRVEAHAVRVGWSSVRSLLAERSLTFDELTAESVEIVQKRTSAARGAPPASLALPVSVAAPAIQVERLAIRIPSATANLERIALGYQYDQRAAEHTLTIRSVQTSFGAGHGELVVAGEEPFALRGLFALRDPTAEFPYEIDLTFGGVLRQIGVGGAAKVEFGQARASAVVQPYSAPLVDRIVLASENIDPRRIKRLWPQGRLAVAIEGGLDEANRFRGLVRVENGLAGPLDRGQIPLSRLTTAVLADADGARLQDLVATDGTTRLSGSGNLDRASLAVTLAVQGLDLARIHSRLRTTRLTGRVATAVRADLQTAQGRLAEGTLALDFDASNAPAALELRAFRLTAGAGSLEGRGEARLEGRYPFQVSGKALGFDPAALGRFPQAALNGTFSAAGTLADSPAEPRRIDARFDLAGSRWQRYTVEGAGELRVAGDRIENVKATLGMAGNRIDIDGAYGAADDVIRWSIAAPRLDALGLDVSGRLSASGTASGLWRDGSRPDLAFTLEADTIAARGIEVGTLRASGNIALNETAPSAITIEARRMRAGDTPLARLEASANGRLDAHTVSLVLTAEAGAWFDAARAELRGAVRELRGWSGTLESLASTGRVPLQLRAPATLAIDAERTRLEGAALAIAGGVVEIARLERRGASIGSEGRYAGVALAEVLAIAGRTAAGWSTDLRLRGAWRVTGWTGASPAAELTLERESGDVTFVRAVAPGRFARAPLGIARLAGAARIEGNRLALTAQLAGNPVGTFSGTLETTLVRRGEVLGIAGSAPLGGKLDLALGSFALLRPFVPDTVVFDGGASGSLNVGGTVGAPVLGGDLTLERVRIALPDEGFRLRNGSAHLVFAGASVRIERARMEGESGSVSATGELGWVGGVPSGHVVLALDQLDSVSDPSYEFALSGTVTASIKDRAIALAGKVRADRGVIRLPEHNTPTLSSDVVIRGRERKADSVSGTTLPETNLDLDLGERFFIRGRGVDARLAGALNLRTGARAPIRLAGVVRAGPGTVSAYGQTLAIERGTLTFTGALDNPQLNVYAIRPNLPSRVGVHVTGFAQEPRVALFSDVAMPDSQKLAWLVLGRSSEGLGATDLAVLGTAAAALLGASDSAPLASRIAGWVGLDEISVRGGGAGAQPSPSTAGPTIAPVAPGTASTGLDETIVSVGKRLSDKLYVSVERSLQTFTAVLRLRYQFNPRWSVQTQTGTVNTIDLFFTLSFD